MTAYFLDCSALVKRYVSETGSAWKQQITDPQAGNLLLIARITCVEVLSALARRRREGSLTPSTIDQLIQMFRSGLDTRPPVMPDESVRLINSEIN